MAFEQLRTRLREGRPLVVDADTGAAFRARGQLLDSPGVIASLLRREPHTVLEHYRAEVSSNVDVLCALTADTTPRALSEVGMQHRAAALTGRAVELAQEAAEESSKPIAIAAVLASDMVSPLAAERVREEFTEHAARIAAAGAEVIVARAYAARIELMAAVTAAARAELPTWAAVEATSDGELAQGGTVSELVPALEDAGAEVVLFEVPSVRVGLSMLERADLAGGGSVHGVLLAGGSQCVWGFPDGAAAPDEWVRDAVKLEAAGARIIGGGAGTTEDHTAALARELGILHPSIPARN